MESRPTPPTTPSAALRDRRREKPLLSCTFCRTRKLRCNRQFPCDSCSSRGIGVSCFYRASNAVSQQPNVGQRIKQLEALVSSLVNQQQSQTPQPERTPLNDQAGDRPAQASCEIANDSVSELSAAVMTIDAGLGNMHLHSHGHNYVGNVHWAAVLDSISELREHYDAEEEAKMLAATNISDRITISSSSPGPRLLYEPVFATHADLLVAIPSRPSVDRLIARYFSAPGITSEIVHTTKFLREYERFWQEPNTTPVMWLGLLFSIMCLATQCQLTMETPADADTLMRMHMFQEHTIYCLVLGQYTRGGEYVLETLINALFSEGLTRRENENGVWLMQGILVQLGFSLGYHRDPSKFKNVSPFTGEMRRRIWSVISQLDLRLSSQMALPRLLKWQYVDATEPRNLLDTDFDETIIELPSSRPETEITPVLYSLAKSRVDRLGGLVSDIVNDTREYPHSEVMDLHRRILAVEESLPPPFRWQPMSQSFMALPRVIMHRIWLQLSIHRMLIWLHRGFLTLDRDSAIYKQSRSSCIEAATKILEFQQLVSEETRSDGLLHPVRAMFSTSRLEAVFLLGMSILCFCLQLDKVRPHLALDSGTTSRIYSLLRSTYSLWLHSMSGSQEARRAIVHLERVLEPLDPQCGDASTAAPSEVASATSTVSFDPLTWNEYEDFMTRAPEPISFENDVLATYTVGSASPQGSTATDNVFPPIV